MTDPSYSPDPDDPSTRSRAAVVAVLIGLTAVVAIFLVMSCVDFGL